MTDERTQAGGGAGGGAGEEAGMIAVVPRSPGYLVDAVRSAGGEVAEVGESTRGVVWLAGDRTDELGELLAAHPAVRWVQLPSAGVDRYADVFAAAGDDVVFTSAKGAYARPVAEHALALSLALARSLARRARATSWEREQRGVSLFGAHVVVIGAGGIALEFLRLIEPFGVRTTVLRRRPDPVPGADRTIALADLDEALADADLVVVAAAATPDTRRLIDASRLARLKEGALLVNIARGELVDTDAVVAALDSGRLGGAGLDVTDPEPLPDGHPLWTRPTALITPHQADTDAMTAPLLAARTAANTRAFLTGSPWEGVVDTDAGY